MQTEVPTLPVVHFNAHKNLNRKQNSNLGRPSVETKTNSPHKNIACLSTKKKTLHPLLGRPYQCNVRQYPTSEQSKVKTNTLEHRVLSAKMLRIKELQNQLADAHYRLNELASENKLLQALQKRQDSALKRYEGTNAELPRIINSHHEEQRILQIKYKKLKTLQKETCDLLKEKEIELQQLQSQNKHLLQLSKDRNLGEREKLQLQVSDLNHRIQQQQDTIQTLHRKLALETKSLKQQIQIEISKRKEVQKHLLETTEKLKTLENFLDNRERRLYCNGQLMFPDKMRRLGTQSLTNLRDISSSNPLKLPEKSKKLHMGDLESNLPMLHSSEVNIKDVEEDEKLNSSQTLNTIKSETMANLDQIRNYRLQKSPHTKIVASNVEERLTKSGYIMGKTTEISVNLESSTKLKALPEDTQKYDTSEDKFKKIYKNRKYQNFHKLEKNELTYSSGGSESENENSKDIYINAASNSKQLHTRLTSSADETSDSKEITFSGYKYSDKLKVLVRERKSSYESDTEAESEMRKESIKHYLTTNHENNAFKLISSIRAKQNCCSYNKEGGKITTSPKSFSNEPEKYDQNLINEVHKQIENMYVQYGVKNVQVEYANSDNLEKYIFHQAESTEHEDNCTVEHDAENTLLQSCLRGEENSSFSNNIELVDTKSEINEIFSNNSQRYSAKCMLHASKNFNEEDKETTEMEVVVKNAFIENSDLETRNKLNKQELENANSGKDSTDNTSTNISVINEQNIKPRITNYNKEKLLASMKAIDDNENIEFSNQNCEESSIMSKKQIVENIFLDFPNHTKKKQDIIKDIFDADVTKNESTDSCNALH